MLMIDIKISLYQGLISKYVYVLYVILCNLIYYINDL